MAFDRGGVELLWERITTYVAAYVANHPSPIATQIDPGMVRPDGTTITVDEDGTIHGASTVDVATSESAGIVKPDGETITIDEDGTIHGAHVGPYLDIRTDGEGRRRLAIIVPEEG